MVFYLVHSDLLTNYFNKERELCQIQEDLTRNDDWRFQCRHNDTWRGRDGDSHILSPHVCGALWADTVLGSLQTSSALLSNNSMSTQVMNSYPQSSLSS